MTEISSSETLQSLFLACFDLLSVPTFDKILSFFIRRFHFSLYEIIKTEGYAGVQGSASVICGAVPVSQDRSKLAVLDQLVGNSDLSNTPSEEPSLAIGTFGRYDLFFNQ